MSRRSLMPVALPDHGRPKQINHDSGYSTFDRHMSKQIVPREEECCSQFQAMCEDPVPQSWEMLGNNIHRFKATDRVERHLHKNGGATYDFADEDKY